MDPIKLHVPHDKAADLSDDLTTWTSATGIDPRLASRVNDSSDKPNDSPHIEYKVYVDESFFEQFPAWREYIEH